MERGARRPSRVRSLPCVGAVTHSDESQRRNLQNPNAGPQGSVGEDT